jgi:hypothetical protein
VYRIECKSERAGALAGAPRGCSQPLWSAEVQSFSGQGCKRAGRTTEAALDASDGTIDSKTKTSVHSRCALAYGVEMIAERNNIKRNFIDLPGRDISDLYYR